MNKMLNAEDLISANTTAIANMQSVANTALAAGVPITKIGPVDVHDLEINFNQGFIEGGISVTPATWEQLGQAYTMFKDEFNRIEAGHYATKKYTVEEVTSFLQ